MDKREVMYMAGQMVMVGFRGSEISPDDEIIRDLYELNIGGVILFDYDICTDSKERNIKNREQVVNLTNSIQAYAQTPMFVAVDQEGGNVVRLKPRHGYEKTLSAAELGALDNDDEIRRTARAIASQVSGSGFNLNLAPVVDVCVNDNNTAIVKAGRSPSDDPDAVIKYAELFIDEHSRVNTVTCIKHFPGHGSSDGDSHHEFVDITASYNEEERLPFQSLIDSGLVDMVMTAHVFNRNYDDSHPFTLSEAAITGMLRKEMGFDGVVISDDLQMEAISAHYSFDSAVIKAVNAGIDILLIGNNMKYDPDAHVKAVHTLCDAVADGVVSYERIAAAFRKITSLKRKIGLL